VTFRVKDASFIDGKQTGNSGINNIKINLDYSIV